MAGLAALIFTPDKYFSNNYRRSETVLTKDYNSSDGDEEDNNNSKNVNFGNFEIREEDKFEREKKYY